MTAETQSRRGLPAIGPAAADSTPVPIDLETVLCGISAGITVQDANGRLLYANDVAAEMTGFETPGALIAASRDELIRRYEILDEAGEPFDPALLPGRRILLGEQPEPTLIGFRLGHGVERWTMLDARAAVLPTGETVAINTFHDVTPRVETERRTREGERRFRVLHW